MSPGCIKKKFSFHDMMLAIDEAALLLIKNFYSLSFVLKIYHQNKNNLKQILFLRI